MYTQEFKFRGAFHGKMKEFIFSIPMENGSVITNKYCPAELINGGINLIKPINGESMGEFINDCQNQIDGMKSSDNGMALIDLHIAGLMTSVMDHISRCGRLIFGDLLIYMDCFSYLLEADGIEEDEIREIYPRVTRTIVELYPNYIFNTADLSPFKGSFFDFVLSNVNKKY